MSCVPSFDQDGAQTPSDWEKLATALAVATAFVNVIVTTSPTLKSTITGGGFDATADTIPGQLQRESNDGGKQQEDRAFC